jgi:predicted component of type VI protein secretion system
MHAYIATAISLGGAIYIYGRQAQSMYDLVCRVSKAEQTTKDIHDVIYDMHGRICAIERDIKHILNSRK